MYTKPCVHTLQLTDGRTITLERGALALQATSAVVVRMGKTVMLATVVGEEQEHQPDFLPLTVDYKENFFSAGKIPGGFLKRQAKLSDDEILKSRLVDRALRPCFPQGCRYAIQVEVHLLSHDKEVIPDSLAILAASAALTTSGIPFNGPVGSVRVGRVAGQWCINPTPALLAQSDVDFTVAGTRDQVIMLEGSAHEISEEEMLALLEFAQPTLAVQCAAQQALAEQAGIAGNVEVADAPQEAPFVALQEFLASHLYPAFYQVAQEGFRTKKERKFAFAQAEKSVLAAFEDKALLAEHRQRVAKLSGEIKREAIRDLVLKKRRRVDGRKPDQVRPLHIAADVLPAAHGAALFSRGETQVLGVITLGSKQDGQVVDDITQNTVSNFNVYYTFPSFSVGEVKPERGPSRRVIGHSNLIKLALKSQLPSESENPYVIDARACTLTCDGSSSQGSISALSAALMDAGIKLKNQVAGVAIGIVVDQERGKHVVLSDIVGDEDACGDIDLKVAGTKNGITACQMDIKINGISLEVLAEMFAQAKTGRLHILDTMNQVISRPRPTFKPHVPTIEECKIAQDKIGALIGPKGKVIQELQKATGTIITVNDEGVVSVFAPDRASSQTALKEIKLLTTEPAQDRQYTGKIVSLKPFGAFVEFLPGKQGLVRISDVREGRIEDITQELKPGEEVEVKLVAISTKNGKPQYSLSMKNLKKDEPSA